MAQIAPEMSEIEDLQRRLLQSHELVEQVLAERDEIRLQLMSYAEDLGSALYERDYAITLATDRENFGHSSLTDVWRDLSHGIPLRNRELRDMHKTVLTLSREKQQLVHAVRRAQVDAMLRLSAAAELKDNDTGTHIERIGHLLVLLAQALGKDESYCHDLFYASRMHDIGKIGIPDNILQKPAALDNDEWQLMRQHPTIGARLLRGSENPLLEMAAEIALGHHEKFDGSGYPNSCCGDEIPLSARIVSLIDFFDALTMDRCYRPAVSDAETLRIIDEQRGKHFDPRIVDAFFSISDKLILARDKINRGGRVYSYFEGMDRGLTDAPAATHVEMRDAAQDSDAPVDLERVAKMKALLAKGEFKVNAEAIADRLIVSFRESASGGV